MKLILPIGEKPRKHYFEERSLGRAYNVQGMVQGGVCDGLEDRVTTPPRPGEAQPVLEWKRQTRKLGSTLTSCTTLSK